MNKKEKKRIKRLNEWDHFYRTSKDKVNDLAKNLHHHNENKMNYNFMVCPGSRRGGRNTDIIEIAYGNRPLSLDERLRQKELDKFPQVYIELNIEYGAQLRYQKMDDGIVSVFLSPAGTEAHHRNEQAILLDKIDMSGKYLIKPHLKALIAYQECTRIDGNPTLKEKFLCWWWMLSKQYLLHSETKFRPSKIKQHSVKIVLAFGSFGAGSFLLAAGHYLLKWW